jgi:hypothetical protein
MKSFITVSIGARASEKRMKPMIIGRISWKPKEAYREALLMKMLKSAKM